MELLTQLREMGYLVQVDGSKIRCQWQGPGHPDPDRVRPLLAELRQQKALALVELRQEARTDPEKALSVRDPFDPHNQLPPGVIVCLPDLDRPGWWEARRIGKLTPVGHGSHQWDAILDLDTMEQESPRTEGPSQPGR